MDDDELRDLTNQLAATRFTAAVLAADVGLPDAQQGVLDYLEADPEQLPGLAVACARLAATFLASDLAKSGEFDPQDPAIGVLIANLNAFGDDLATLAAGGGFSGGLRIHPPEMGDPGAN